MSKKGLNINKVIAYLKAESTAAKVIDLSDKSAVAKKLFCRGTCQTTSVVYRNTRNFNKMKNYVLKYGNIDEIIQMANAGIKTLDFKEIEAYVKTLNDPRSAYRFVKSFPSVDRKDFEKIILNSNNPEYIAKYCVACNPGDYQLNKFQEALCGITDNIDARRGLAIFFKHVKNANRDKVGKAFIDTYFSKDLPKNESFPHITEEEVKSEVHELFTKHAKLRNDKTPYKVYVGQDEKKESKLKLDLLDYLDCNARFYEVEQLKKQRGIKTR